jgi:hypothetical protein
MPRGYDTSGRISLIPEKQQMRWTPRGAHLLLQICTRVLNHQLADDFQRWYPRFTRAPDTAVLTA